MQYEYERQGTTASSYTIRSKTIDMIDKNLTYRRDPGPGTYEAVDLDPKNKTKVSRFKGAQLGIISRKTRF